MKVSEKEVRYVAELARISLSPGELRVLAKDLNKILTYFEKLKEVDTTGVLPTAHALAVKNRFRRDIVGPSLPREKVLKNAQAVKEGSFMVPQIIE